MKRGDLFRVHKGNKNDTKDYRTYLIVSRQMLIDIPFPTLICAPVRTKFGGLPTQVEIGIDEGLKHDSAVYCDELIKYSKIHDHKLCRLPLGRQNGGSKRCPLHSIGCRGNAGHVRVAAPGCIADVVLTAFGS